MIKHTTIERTDLFHGQWQYRLKAYQPEFSCLRRLDHDYIDRVIHVRRSWGQTLRQPQPGSWRWVGLDITDSVVQNLHRMCDFLMASKSERKLVIAQSWFYVYSNDLDWLERMSELSWLDPKLVELSSVQLIGSPGLLIRKKPGHNKRSWFKCQELSEKQKLALKTLLGSYEDIRVSPALQDYMDQSHRYRMMDYYFVDHNDDSLQIMLALIEPGLIRKTVAIIQHK